MHMPPKPSRAPILASDPITQARRLWKELAAQDWPVPPALLPAGSALVGGAVRDGLLGRLPQRPDLDLVVPGDAIALARRLAGERGGNCVVLDRERSIARLVLHGWTIDLARRAGASLVEDLQRRDFTVNAIGLPLDPAGGEAELVDPLAGLADLAAARLVAVSEVNLLDDPLRLLRGIRLATELDFCLAPLTWQWIRTHHARIGAVAGERVLGELERLAAAPSGEQGLERVLEAGLLEPWGAAGTRPGLAHLSSAAAGTRGLDAAEAERALPLARLAMTLGGEALSRLPLSRRLEVGCRRLRHWRDRLAGTAGSGLESLPEVERLTLHRELEAQLPALILMIAIEPAEARRLMGRWRDPGDALFHPHPPLNGRILQRHLGLAPGPLLGRLIDHLTQERAFGRLGPSPGPTETDPGRTDPGGEDSQEEILQAARSWLAAQGAPRHG